MCRRAAIAMIVGVAALSTSLLPSAAASDAKVEQVVRRGLDWLVARQSRRGSW